MRCERTDSGGMAGTALVLAACTGRESARSPSESQSSAGESSTFSNPAEITNQYVPLAKGGRWIYEGNQSGKPQLIEIAVTPGTKTIDWNGDPIERVVVRRRGWVDGILKQESHDYYAQKDDGSVWAMGEQVDNFKGEKLFDHSGSWLAGVDGATPGLVMPANPRVENASITEDVIGLVDAGSYEVLSRTESVTTAAGQVDNGLLLSATLANPAAESLFVPQIGAVLARSGSNEVSLTDRLPHNAESASAAKFSHPTTVDNPYFGVTGVDYRLYLGKEEGEPLRIEVAPTGKNETLKWKGRETAAAISQFTATSGRSLLEIAVDWFAQDDAGNVWYFGEDVWNYEKGRVANTDGSWTAGVDGPPGLIMPAIPASDNDSTRRTSPATCSRRSTSRRWTPPTSLPTENASMGWSSCTKLSAMAWRSSSSTPAVTATSTSRSPGPGKSSILSTPSPTTPSTLLVLRN